MTIIVGLGNPGSEYTRSRHNAGFLVIEAMLRVTADRDWQVVPGKKFQAEVWQSDDLILAKPQTFMNESGRAVQALLHWYKVSPANLIVAHDDLDLALGMVKLQWAKSPKIHNGINSIVQQLGTTDFWHLRVGVDGRQGDRTMPGAAYVLQQFAAAEKAILQPAIDQAVQDVWRQLPRLSSAL